MKKRYTGYQILIGISLFSLAIVFILNHLVLSNAQVMDNNPSKDMYLLALTHNDQIMLFIISMIPVLLQILIIGYFVYIFYIKKEALNKTFYSSLVMIICSILYTIITYINRSYPLLDVVFIGFMLASWISKVVTLILIRKTEKELNYA